MEWIYQYSLFLMKSATVVIAVVFTLVFIISQRRKMSSGEELQLTDLSAYYQDMQEQMQTVAMDDFQFKNWEKQQKKDAKQDAKKKKKEFKKGEVEKAKPHLFVVSFNGSMDAHEVENLRKEITAILSVAKTEDEVLLNLESPGGVVHGYGLAASQLTRLRHKNIRLVVAVDKVAASGGYMMACVANQIVAAPFAILGSIGVVAQLPNIHRLLKKNDIDIELHTAGEYKRTLTVLGENTEDGREKFKEELNETHQLFKTFVHENRPSLDIDRVATGEHWFGLQAKEKGLVDEIGTSDDLILAKIESHRIIGVRHIKRKKLTERFSNSATESIDRLLLRWWQRGQKPLI